MTTFERLNQHIATMAPHQRERQAGQLLVDARDEIARLRAALKPFAVVGGWFCARPHVPDETPAVELRGINGVNGVIGALTRGDFKAANVALRCGLTTDGLGPNLPERDDDG